VRGPEAEYDLRHLDTVAFRAQAKVIGMRVDPHGRDERVPVKSFWQGQEYQYRLVKMLAGGK
jgi:hypothetical protein